MKYYNLSISDDLEVIGYYPQTSLAKGYNPTVSHGYIYVRPYEFPDFVPDFEIEINKKAKITNFLPKEPASFGLVIDEKVKYIFKKYNLPPHAFYPIKVYHYGKLLEYYWFHCIPNDFWKLIDIESSYAEISKVEKGISKTIGTIPILSHEQITEEKKIYTGLTPIRLGELRMRKEFTKYDFYQTGAFNHILISENLKNELYKNNITGYNIKLFDKITFE